MSTPPIAKAVAKVLAEESIDVPAPRADVRARTIAAIRAQIVTREKQRTRRRLAFRVAAAAAAVLIFAFAYRVIVQKPTSVAHQADSAKAKLVAEDVHGSVFVLTESGKVPLARGTALTDDQSVLTDDGDTTVSFRAGSRVRIDSKTEAAMSEIAGTELVRVKNGIVTAMVAKLGPTERFIVRTEEAELEAHGTVFRVARTMQAQCGVIGTAVHVVEGRISVRDNSGERFLNQGEDWSSACAHPIDHETVAPSATPSAPRPIAPQVPMAPIAPTAPSLAIVPSASAASAPIETQSPEVPALTAPAAPASPSAPPYPEFGRRK